jgi:hypothetical protein
VRRCICLVAVLLLAARWTTPLPAPPLFDGLGLGNEPYRYVHRPPGHKATPPPTKARKVVAMIDGKSAPFDVSTFEMYPQASITASGGALTVPRAAKSITVTVSAVPPQGEPPTGWVYDGNLYRFTAVTDTGRPVALAADAVVRIAFRGTGKRGKPSIGLYTSHRWRVHPAPSTGVSAQYSTTISALGDGVLIVPRDAAEETGGIPAGVVVGVACVGILTTLLGLLRLARKRRTEEN